jgi:hypothetical protein
MIPHFLDVAMGSMSPRLYLHFKIVNELRKQWYSIRSSVNQRQTLRGALVYAFLNGQYSKDVVILTS